VTIITLQNGLRIMVSLEDVDLAIRDSSSSHSACISRCASPRTAITGIIVICELVLKRLTATGL